MSEKIILAVLTVVSIIVFIVGFLRKIKVVLAGKAEQVRFNRLWDRFKRIILEVFLQRKVLSNRPIAGLLHIFVFFGFLLFIIETINHFSIGFGSPILLKIFGKYYSYYETGMAIVAIFVTISIVGFAFRRFILVKISPDPKSFTSGLVALFIFLLMTTYLDKFGLDYIPSKLNWWIHTIIILVFPILILNSKHMHIILAPISIFLRTLRLAQLKVLNLDVESFESSGEPDLGLEKVKDIPWKLRLDFLTCVECKRCRDACPANISGQELDPALFILNGQKIILNKKGEIPVIGNIITEKALGQCTTCLSCESVCPVGIEHLQLLIGAKRAQALSIGTGGVAFKFFKAIENYGNPFSASRQVRTDLINDLKIPIFKPHETEWALWLGCVWAYNPDFKKVVSNTTELLKKAGINFGIIDDEKCSGHHSRRQGEELQFQNLAKENIAKIKQLKINKILTGCPHCFHTLSKEYSDIEPDFKVQVIHHSVFLLNLIKSGKLIPRKIQTGNKTTYHDPCYLSRQEGIYIEPRRVIKELGIELIELHRNKLNTFCCGGGATGFIEESKEPVRIDMTRKNEIKNSSANLLLTACPQCKMMLNGAVDYTKDIAELVWEQVSSLE